MKLDERGTGKTSEEWYILLPVLAAFFGLLGLIQLVLIAWKT